MISVVIPTYNEERNIVRCLESLLDQTVPRSEYELIVVDGNSKDRTRELAEPLADQVLIQTSPKVGGARNDGAKASKGGIIVTTDADCIFRRDFIERIRDDFERDSNIVQLYGTVSPIEGGVKNHLFLTLANWFSRLGYYTHAFYYTLGCNSSFRREAFFNAGMYRIIDAGDDLEIAKRMRKIGKVKLDTRLKVGFSMRRYEQYGTLRSLWEWIYIVAKGGDAGDVTYTRREYK